VQTSMGKGRQDALVFRVNLAAFGQDDHLVPGDFLRRNLSPISAMPERHRNGAEGPPLIHRLASMGGRSRLCDVRARLADLTVQVMRSRLRSGYGVDASTDAISSASVRSCSPACLNMASPGRTARAGKISEGACRGHGECI
jgi:hypothetical protein